MNVLFLSGRETSYPRNDVILRALNKISHVDVIHPSTTHRSILFNSLFVAIKALPKILLNKYDVVFIGFYGHFLMVLYRWILRTPVIFDAFISTYDTLCFDRRLFSPKHLVGRLAFYLDWTACRAATKILLDTETHVAYFISTFGLPGHRFSSLPVSCNEDLFHPCNKQQAGERSTVLYYTSYQPLHGVEFVIESAKHLRDQQIHFKIIGNGLTKKKVLALVKKYPLSNVTMLPPVPIHKLAEEVCNATILLGGPFGATPKAQRVIPGKTYQCLAMGKPVIVTDTPANRELLTHGKDAYFCKSADSKSLSDAILKLHNDLNLRDQIASQGLETFIAKCSEDMIKAQLNKVLIETIQSTHS